MLLGNASTYFMVVSEGSRKTLSASAEEGPVTLGYHNELRLVFHLLKIKPFKNSIV